MEANPEIYKKRQAIVEHPFGTIKRQWGFNYILTKKTKQRANADVGFMFIAYNLKRIMNIIGIDKLMEYLKTLISILISSFWGKKYSKITQNLFINSFLGFFTKFDSYFRNTIYFNILAK